MASSPGNTQEKPPTRVFAPKPPGRVRRSAYFRNPYVAKRRGPSPREIFLFLLLLAVLLVADGVYVLLKIQTPLNETARLLEIGASALQEGDVVAARTAFAEATDEAEQAESLAARPSLFLASHTPWFNNDADAIRALARSAHLFAAAGTEAANAIETLGGTSREEIAEALYDEGQLQFETIGAAQNALAAVSENLTEARRILESTPYPRIQRLQAAFESARDQVMDVQPRAAAAARLLAVVPRMMGLDEPRHYFVALQNQSEARATGGLIGLYGIMEADQGRIRLTRVGPSFELATEIDKPLETGILLPSWYAERYGDAVDFAGINRSPDFPLVASTIVQMYRNATGSQLDGVWSFDPLAFQQITKATGPLHGPGFDVDIGPDNAADVLLRQSYEHFGTKWEEQVGFLVGVIQDLYDKLGSSQADTPALFDALAKAAQGSHFKIYSSDPEEQLTLKDLGIDGGLVTDGPPRQLVFHNNFEGNKVDGFLQRTIHSSVQLTEQGGALVTTTVELDNQAPSEPASILLGYPQRGERVGYNHMELNFVLPKSAHDISATLDGLPAIMSQGAEGEFPQADMKVGIQPGDSRRVVLVYSLDKVQRFRTNARDFRFVLVPQPTALPDRYEVEVTAPPSYDIHRPGATRLQDTITYRGLLDVPVTIRAIVVRS